MPICGWYYGNVGWMIVMSLPFVMPTGILYTIHPFHRSMGHNHNAIMPSGGRLGTGCCHITVHIVIVHKTLIWCRSPGSQQCIGGVRLRGTETSERMLILMTWSAVILEKSSMLNTDSSLKCRCSMRSTIISCANFILLSYPKFRPI